jgi:hypothetical protein
MAAEHVTETKTLETWAILELMGHRRLAGFLTEREIAGTAFLQIDVPGPASDEIERSWTTQFYAPSAVYAITPTTEEIALELAKDTPRPIQPWELRNLLPTPPISPGPAVVAIEHEEDEFSDQYPY